MSTCKRQRPSCATCRYYERDRGTFTATGWTKSHINEGECRAQRPGPNGWPKVEGSDRCGAYEPEGGS